MKCHDVNGLFMCRSLEELINFCSLEISNQVKAMRSDNNICIGETNPSFDFCCLSIMFAFLQGETLIAQSSATYLKI